MSRAGVRVNENKEWATYPRGENRINLLLLEKMDNKL